MSCEGSANIYIISLSQDGGSTYDQISGQLEGTHTSGGTNIDITNKSDGGAITMLESCVVGKQSVFTGSFVGFNAVDLNIIRDAIESGDFLDIQIESGLTDETWVGKYAVSARSDSAPVSDKVTMSITFSSSGAYTYTRPTDPV